MPWQDGQFWLVTLAMVLSLRVLFGTFQLPSRGSGAKAQDSKGPTCAGCTRCPEPESDSVGSLVVLGDSDC